jgi:hypothetical protein
VKESLNEGTCMPKLNIWFRAVALTLCLLLAHVPGTLLLAQNPPAPPRLLITILDGEGALNNIKQRTAREPIIQVQDENHKPVAGALVLFVLPSSGPSGTFLDGTQMYTTTTNANGQAVARGLKPNQVSGKFQIQVKATYNGDTSQTVINQTNGSGSSAVTQHAAAHAIPVKVIIIVAAAAAAGGIAAGILLTRGNNSTTITPGTPTVGAP